MGLRTKLRFLADRHKQSGLPIVIDEVQRVPEILLGLKRVVDEDNRRGQFVLTGSADVFGLSAAGDSLAGRVQPLVLRPLIAEIYGAVPCRLLDAVEAGPTETLSRLPAPQPYSRRTVVDLILRGGFPEIRGLDDGQRMAVDNSYIDSVIVRDVPVVAPIRKPDLLRRLIDHLAARTAQELNIAKLCDAVGARKETVGAWVDRLERVSSWASAASKRPVHWPKLHLLDTGCATAIRNETATSFDLGADPTALGPILESYVHQELDKSLPLLKSKLRCYARERAPQRGFRLPWCGPRS